MKFSRAPMCEVCDRIKGPANHWRIGLSWSNFVGLAPWPKTDESFDERAVALCGDACALKWQAKQLEELRH